MPIDKDGPPRVDTPCLPPAVGGSGAGGLTAEVIRENQDWVRGLSATGDIHERASRRRHRRPRLFDDRVDSGDERHWISVPWA